MDGFIMENPNFQWMIWGENPPFKETPVCCSIRHFSILSPISSLKKKSLAASASSLSNPMVPWPHANRNPLTAWSRVGDGRPSERGDKLWKMYVYIYSIWICICLNMFTCISYIYIYIYKLCLKSKYLHMYIIFVSYVRILFQAFFDKGSATSWASSHPELEVTRHQVGLGHQIKPAGATTMIPRENND